MTKESRSPQGSQEAERQRQEAAGTDAVLKALAGVTPSSSCAPPLSFVAPEIRLVHELFVGPLQAQTLTPFPSTPNRLTLLPRATLHTQPVQPLTSDL